MDSPLVPTRRAKPVRVGDWVESSNWPSRKGLGMYGGLAKGDAMKRPARSNKLSSDCRNRDLFGHYTSRAHT
jgi:hypothetical protein